MYCRISVARRLHSGVRHTLLRAGVGRAVSIVIGAETGLYRDGLARSLGRRKGIRVVGTAADPEALVGQMREHAPDVVLFDVAGDGASHLGTLFEAVPHAKVIVLGLPETEAEVVTCVQAGVAGFVAGNSSLEELVACIRAAARDEVVFSPRVAAILLGRLRTLAAGN